LKNPQDLQQKVTRITMTDRLAPTQALLRMSHREKRPSKTPAEPLTAFYTSTHLNAKSGIWIWIC
jgi:hypothetical protein